MESDPARVSSKWHITAPVRFLVIWSIACTVANANPASAQDTYMECEMRSASGSDVGSLHGIAEITLNESAQSGSMVVKWNGGQTTVRDISSARFGSNEVVLKGPVNGSLVKYWTEASIDRTSLRISESGCFDHPVIIRNERFSGQCTLRKPGINRKF